MMMSLKHDFIKWRAEYLDHHGKTERYRQLATVLNALGIRTEDGDQYQGVRGTAALVRYSWHYFTNLGDHATAGKIANSFVKADGKYAYM
jgi:hypothetical protein